jgi:thermostable 8-oxoguanine DNA glycosylase
MQRMEAFVDEQLHVLEIPDETDELIEGLSWGRFDHIFSPAFWFSRAWYQRALASNVVCRLGENLAEEIVACLLGGYGLPAEVGLAAFDRLKQRGLLCAGALSEKQIFSALTEPLTIGGRLIHYRYPKQRSHFVAEALKRLQTNEAPVTNDLALRDWLLRFKGIGPKTASWITRNFLDSDNVAIIDIHIYRAGLLAGLFRPEQSVLRDYDALEVRLVHFAQALNVRLAILDTLMWCEMRQMGSFAIEALRSRGYPGTVVA